MGVSTEEINPDLNASGMSSFTDSASSAGNAAVANVAKKKKKKKLPTTPTGTPADNTGTGGDTPTDPGKPNIPSPVEGDGFNPKTGDTGDTSTDPPPTQEGGGFNPKHHGKGNGGQGSNKDGNGITITPGLPNPKDPSQINIADYSSQLATDPSLGFTGDDPNTKDVNESMKLEDHLSSYQDVKDMTKAGLIGDQKGLDSNQLNVDNKDVGTVKDGTAHGYDVATTQDKVANQDIDPATGRIKNQDLVQAAQTNISKIAQGAGLSSTDPDQAVGEALSKYASVNMSNIIDTSTAAGKLLAQQLGEGNYVDSKATLEGQLAILQGQFVDPTTGEPKIPSWAAATARNVSQIAAFKGMSGSAATAAMSQALLEASIPIAQADSQFYQTLTLQNLDNKQQSIINTANTLSKFEQTNTDNRMAAAIQNAKNFMDMDMANLSNDQQARVINNQQRVQSILSDANAKNTERLSVAQNQDDMDKFYDQLNTQIKQYNSSQDLSAQEFNSNLEDSRQKFNKEMQYNIDVANAKWRQEVQLNEDQQQFQAATTDVKNMVDLSVSQLNQLWDRSDSLLDYAWKSSDNDLNRKNELAKIALTGKYASNDQMMQSLGLLAGTFVGSGVGQKLLGGIFGL